MFDRRAQVSANSILLSLVQPHDWRIRDLFDKNQIFQVGRSQGAVCHHLSLHFCNSYLCHKKSVLVPTVATGVQRIYLDRVNSFVSCDGL